MQKESKALELSCYVAGAGAFGIFFRWMQLQLAYDEAGLVNRSSLWNAFVLALIVIMYFVFRRFTARFEKSWYFLPEDFCSAFRNDTKPHLICRWAFGGVIALGGIVLLMTCETHRNAKFLMVIGAGAIVTGLCLSLLLHSANKPAVHNRSLTTFLSVEPIVFLGVWMLECYKENAINPVAWDYAIEVIALILSIIAFLRLAGYAYGLPDEFRTMRSCMMASMVCLMTLSDPRNIGEQIIFAGLALMFLMIDWIMIDNLRKGRKPLETESVDIPSAYDRTYDRI